MSHSSDKFQQEKEIQSLVGKVDKAAMGQRDEKAKPKKSAKGASNKSKK